MTRFIAVDGEADDDGNYVLLCDSTGRVLYRPGGISTLEAFGFLLQLPRKHELVCYGLNYDSNQWLKDVPLPTLRGLATHGVGTFAGMYRLEWVPSKMFTLSVPGKTVTVCEVFGFFQCSFIKALEQWGFDPPRIVEEGKQARGTFAPDQIRNTVAYCLTECRMLVQMMERLQDACKQANCLPRRRWIGAGSIASSLLTRNGVKHHHVHDADLFGRELTDDYVLRAYYGGRVELYRQGWHANAVASDVRSAYPSAACNLPSLTTATVRKRKQYDPHAVYALWRVSWENAEGQIAPFPVRLPSGSICYPRAGSGVYHAAEVATAIRLGYDVTVHDGVTLSTESEDCFSWIPEVFEHRARFKRQGSYAEKALKLGLNSVYGKMAQGYGFGKKPPFQSYFWAGYITSMTRARVLSLLATSRSPVMCSTDGVVTLDVAGQESASLGGWEVTHYDKLATVQPGVYIVDQDGERFTKSRGFRARDVDYDEMVREFEHDPRGAYYFDSRRFIGLKVALHRKDFSVWRTWPQERRSIAFEVRNKQSEYHDSHVMLYPPRGPYDSLPYVPKQSLYDDPSEETMEHMLQDDQPHMEVH